MVNRAVPMAKPKASTLQAAAPDAKSTKESAALLRDEGTVGAFSVDDTDGLPVPLKKVGCRLPR